VSDGSAARAARFRAAVGWESVAREGFIRGCDFRMLTLVRVWVDRLCMVRSFSKQPPWRTLIRATVTCKRESAFRLRNSLLLGV